MKFKTIFSPNYLNTKRSTNSIKFIILHYTGMQSERASVKRLTSIKNSVSAHYLINRKGDIIKMIDEKARFGRVHAISYDSITKTWAGAADPDWEGTVEYYLKP